MSMWNAQRGRCAYTNLPMCWGTINVSDWTISIERLENGWYKKGNLALIVAECNSTEYKTNRFDKENAGIPIGWDATVAENYRNNFMKT